MPAGNSYDDQALAQAYARLEYPGTYYLAFRDMPAIIGRHNQGGIRALDFGCGAGRSTRFLKQLGYSAVGVDISADMLLKARELDPDGDYRLLDNNMGRFEKAGQDTGAEAAAGGSATATGATGATGDRSGPGASYGLRREFAPGSFDLVLAAFPFDNIPDPGHKIRILQELSGLLTGAGIIVNLVSSPEIYTHEWMSFSTRDFPENRLARSGERVKIIITDLDDQRPVEDTLCTDADYLDIYSRASLRLIGSYQPLGRNDEPYDWINEACIPPWTIYVLCPDRN